MNRLALMVIKNIFAVPGAYIKLCKHAKHPEKYPEIERYRHLQYIFKKANKAGNINLCAHGQKNIPTEGGFMVYANHQGLFDIMAIAATCDSPLGAVLKKELYDIPFMKQIVDTTQSFPMDRDDIRQSMVVMQKVTEEVKKGRNYLIFPEGTRSKLGNKLLEFHGGSFKCAYKAKAPIVPVALIDCFKVLDQKGSKPVDVQIHYLEPIPYEEYKDMKTVELAQMVHDRIEKVVSVQ